MGTLFEWVQQQNAEAVRPTEADLKAALQRTPALHSDEIGARRSERLACAHAASIAHLTYYAIHAMWGSEATNEFSILPKRHRRERT